MKKLTLCLLLLNVKIILYKFKIDCYDIIDYILDSIIWKKYFNKNQKNYSKTKHRNASITSKIITKNNKN
jgi:hypothetical protein